MHGTMKLKFSIITSSTFRSVKWHLS